MRARVNASAWKVELDGNGGAPATLRARALVNAAGPWAAQLLRRALGRTSTKALRLVKGSHIVVPRLFAHDHAYIFQNADGRIIFAIPYEQRFTLIGTTDIEWAGEAAAVAIDESEIAYLCEQANRYFAQPVRPADVVWSYSGVRPLIDDESGNPAAATRDYRLELSRDGGAPLLSVWGGKITTYRRLAEETADLMCGVLAQGGPRWTESAMLLEGDRSGWIDASGQPDVDRQRFKKALARRVPQLDAATCARWSRSYGTLAHQIIGYGSLGTQVAPGLHEAELRHLREHEWARCADDALWRRSKLGLHYSAVQRESVHDWWTRCTTGASESPR